MLFRSDIMTTHTPGPWHVRPDYGKENVYRLWDKNDNYHDDTSPEAMDANAVLMAAAPKLLEALKLAHTWMKHQGKESRVVADAIATAEGSA